MIQHLKLKGDLKFGQHKCISCNVELEVDTHEDDEWAEPDPNYNPDNYIDGVRVTGEFSFDAGPIDAWRDKHPIKPNAIGELMLRDGDESSKLNILVVERTAVVDIVPKKIKRYFWLFFVVGKPIWDSLGIFPENYRGVKMNRVFACTDFRGYWPVGVASVIVAADKREAKTLLDQKLREAGIPIEGDGDYTLTEISTDKKGATILNNGDWQ
jgi:hypothetical protein